MSLIFIFPYLSLLQFISPMFYNCQCIDLAHVLLKFEVFHVCVVTLDCMDFWNFKSLLHNTLLVYRNITDFAYWPGTLWPCSIYLLVLVGVFVCLFADSFWLLQADDMLSAKKDSFTSFFLIYMLFLFFLLFSLTRTFSIKENYKWKWTSLSFSQSVTIKYTFSCRFSFFYYLLFILLFWIIIDGC